MRCTNIHYFLCTLKNYNVKSDDYCWVLSTGNKYTNASRNREHMPVDSNIDCQKRHELLKRDEVISTCTGISYSLGKTLHLLFLF